MLIGFENYLAKYIDSYNEEVKMIVGRYDPATGEVLSFARNGRIDLPIQSEQIEVFFSDGIRSSERILRTVR